MADYKAMDAVPKSAQVGPFRYEISFDMDASYDYSYLGTTLYRSRRIKLDPRQANTDLPQTFLHEMLHALGNAYEITDWDRHTRNDKQEITDKIDLMSSALLQWLRANPDAVAWLVAGG